MRLHAALGRDARPTPASPACSRATAQGKRGPRRTSLGARSHAPWPPHTRTGAGTMSKPRRAWRSSWKLQALRQQITPHSTVPAGWSILCFLPIAPLPKACLSTSQPSTVTFLGDMAANQTLLNLQAKGSSLLALTPFLPLPAAVRGQSQPLKGRLRRLASVSRPCARLWPRPPTTGPVLAFSSPPRGNSVDYCGLFSVAHEMASVWRFRAHVVRLARYRCCTIQAPFHFLGSHFLIL